ncbi:MAG: hypothetical protein HY671_13175 [Chloroflexi bacterium]|nr:hypothetical protein [Chloroflexota bacterium]
MVLTHEGKTLFENICEPGDIVRGLEQFRRSAKVLSSRKARLAERYPGEWVAVHEGKVKAHRQSLVALLEDIDTQQLPRQHVVIRFIDTSGRKLVL